MMKPESSAYAKLVEQRCRRSFLDFGLAAKKLSTTKNFSTRHDITHIVTVMPTFTNEAGVRMTQLSPKVHQYRDTKVSRLIVPAEDIPTQNMLQYFSRSTEFILAALCNGGHVLVHCLAGASRSPTVVAAFLMEVYRLTPSQAVAKIRESRPLVHPIIEIFRSAPGL